MTTPNIDFTVFDIKDPKYLLVADLSEYFFIENKPAIIQITLPGGQNPYDFQWRKHQTNVFNSNQFNLSCQECDEGYIDLPDGIYTIEVTASPETFTKKKYHLRLNLLQDELDKIYIKHSLEFTTTTEDFRDWYFKINIKKEAAEAYTRKGEVTSAKRELEEVYKLLDKQKECKNCF